MKPIIRCETSNTGVAVGVALALACATAMPARAADEADASIAGFTTPETSYILEFGYLAEASRRFGQYTGLTDEVAYVPAGIDYVRRDDATGTWYRLTGRNLGLESRELRGEYQRQGNWDLYVDYSRFVRNEPLLVTTALAGIGTSVQTINGAPRSDQDLQIDRDRITLGFSKSLPKNLEFALRFRNETRDGDRIFGRGSGQFLAEPIDSRTQQIDATMSYIGPRLQLAAGYYGSMYTNHPSFIDVNTGADIALSPDNEFHQLSVSGGYSFTPTARTTFKLAFGRGTQNERFFTAPDFAGNTRTSLDGRVDVVNGQLGFTARPFDGFSVLANLRYEDRRDRTPRFQFLAASTGRDGFNTPFSRTSKNGRFELSYQLPRELRLTGGVDLDWRERSTLSIRQASWRLKNDESTYRVELRRGLSQTLSGAVSFMHADRSGSAYLPANNNAAADFIDPLHFADRARNKVRMSFDWTPLEPLSIQAMLDDSRDVYAGRALGPVSGRARFYSIDGTYTLNDVWTLNAWTSRDENRADQATISGANGVLVLAQTWSARQLNRGESFGAGVTGRPTEKLEVGLNFQHERDTNEYHVAAALPAAAVLPDIDTRHDRVSLFLQYAVRDSLGLRLDYVRDDFRTNDWTWTGWAYADGSSVLLVPDETGSFIGVSAIYRPR